MEEEKKANLRKMNGFLSCPLRPERPRGRRLPSFFCDPTGEDGKQKVFRNESKFIFLSSPHMCIEASDGSKVA